MTFSKMFSPSGAGQQCCYSKPANGEPGSILPFRLGNGQLAGGTFDRAHYKRPIPIVSHYWHDVRPFLYCCVPSGRSECDSLYSGMRYTDDCGDYVPPRPGGYIKFQVTKSIEQQQAYKHREFVQSCLKSTIVSPENLYSLFRRWLGRPSYCHPGR